MSIDVQHRFYFSNNFLELFQRQRYEKYVLDIMNKSERFFPNTYDMVLEQSSGQCDFIDCKTNEKFDAKIPFESKHMEMLTQGKKHEPDILGWIKVLGEEAEEYNKVIYKQDSINNLKLYNTMKKQVEKEKDDENIVFFLPFPIILSVEGSVFCQFGANYLNDIYSQLNEDLDLANRKIYVIYPSIERYKFAIKKIDEYYIEYVECEELGEYFFSEAYL